MGTPRMQAETGPTRAARRPKILLLGDASLTSYFRLVLEKRGCECSVGSWACQDPRKFDFILSASPIEEKEALLSRLTGSRCAVFTCQRSDEDGFVWAPAMLQGERCVKMRAMNPSEFIAYLDGMEKAPTSV